MSIEYAMKIGHSFLATLYSATEFSYRVETKMIEPSRKKIGYGSKSEPQEKNLILVRPDKITIHKKNLVWKMFYTFLKLK